MNKDDLIRMAREANWYASHQTGDSHEWQNIRDERFAALVAAAEREHCAKVCEEVEKANLYGVKECAAAIRARGQA